MGTIINPGFKNSRTRLWSDYGYFKSLSCDFPMERSNVAELAILNINQVYFTNKYEKKIYYYDLFVIGQVTPMLNLPENLEKYVPDNDEVKILRPKYDFVSGQVLGLVETLAYLSV